MFPLHPMIEMSSVSAVMSVQLSRTPLGALATYSPHDQLLILHQPISALGVVSSADASEAWKPFYAYSLHGDGTWFGKQP